MSQLTAFAFLMAYLSVRPYIEAKHHWFQAIAMTIPGLGMSWALVGRAESETDAAKGGTGYDVYGLISVHLALIVPVFCRAIFAILSAIWMLVRAILKGGADAVAFAALKAAGKLPTKRKPAKQRGAKASTLDEDIDDR